MPCDFNAFSVDGLRPGVAYTFQVQAVTRVGQSDLSESSDLVVLGVPGERRFARARASIGRPPRPGASGGLSVTPYGRKTRRSGRRRCLPSLSTPGGRDRNAHSTALEGKLDAHVRPLTLGKRIARSVAAVAPPKLA